MVMLQVNLSEKANKKLELFKLYAGKETKALALNSLLEEYDLNDVREGFLGGEDE
jgi:3-deoxy-D-manno-octulosonate 8-phosphate phosphatase KdsC-like HAD superfamily phosphatase